jgi:small subunit ribosomal protein S13e
MSQRCLRDRNRRSKRPSVCCLGQAGFFAQESPPLLRFPCSPFFAHPSRSLLSTSSTNKKYSTQVTDQICKLAKKGYTPSQIGVALRDQHGVAQVGAVTNSKVLRILKGAGLAPEIPEDLYYLIKKAVSMRKHLDGFRKDRDGKFRLILVESRIHRLARYYKRAKKLPPTWKYESATASALVA